jgi:hypothetical protein
MWKTSYHSLFAKLLGRRPHQQDDVDVTSGKKPYGLLALLIVSLIYTLTIAPAVYTYDSAELTLGVYYQGIIHSSGYPAYLILGRLWLYLPIHPDYAVRLNLFSVVMGTLTAYTLFKINAQVIGYMPAANTAAVLLFAFSPEIWAHSVVAEVYAMHTLLIALALYAWVRHASTPNVSYLYVLAITFGIAFAHHLAAVLVAFVVYPFALWYAPNWRTRFRMMVTTGSITLLLYLYLPLRFAANPEINILEPYFARNIMRPDHLVWLILGGMFDDRMFTYPFGEYLVELGRFVRQLFRHYHVAVVIGVIGIVDFWKRHRAFSLMLLSVFFGQVLFFASYDVFDKWTMFHTAYLVWAVFVAAGLARLMEYDVKQIGAVVLAALVIIQVGLNWTRAGHFRDRSTADKVEQTLAPLPADALLLGPWTTIWPALYYQKVKGWQPGVQLYNYTVLGLGLRDQMPTASEQVWFEAVQAEIDRVILCHPGHVYIVEPSVIAGRFTTSFVDDELYRVQRTNAAADCPSR